MDICERDMSVAIDLYSMQMSQSFKDTLTFSEVVV
jgi:hypothetical protein